jgi:prepilin-type N-terminal cleavage/methylation domain-containing protein
MIKRIIKHKKILSSTTSHPIKSDVGFTLLEVMTVLAIIGIISLISMPIYLQIRPTLTLNSETRDVVSDLRYAQQLAVTEQTNYSIELNQAQNKYTITNTETSTIVKDENIKTGISIQSISGFTTDTIIFNVTGAALESGSFTLANLNNATTTITIKPSGYVKIE